MMSSDAFRAYRKQVEITASKIAKYEQDNKRGLSLEQMREMNKATDEADKKCRDTVLNYHIEALAAKASGTLPKEYDADA